MNVDQRIHDKGRVLDQFCVKGPFLDRLKVRLLWALSLYSGLHVGIEQGAAPVGGADLGSGQAAGSAQVCAGERCAVKVGITQDGAGQHCSLQVCGLQIGIQKDRAFEFGSVQIGLGQFRGRQVGLLQIGERKDALLQLGVAQVGERQVGA